tara:strand:+ start:1901 stop:2008 length:108 start_codon:yes stop_codon:yes gene_type:complete
VIIVTLNTYIPRLTAGFKTTTDNLSINFIGDKDLK